MKNKKEEYVCTERGYCPVCDEEGFQRRVVEALKEYESEKVNRLLGKTQE